MARSVTLISELATQVLARVSQEELVKQAALTHTSKELTTGVGQGLQKLAAAVRVADDVVTYEDLAVFRSQYGI